MAEYERNCLIQTVSDHIWFIGLTFAIAMFNEDGVTACSLSCAHITPTISNHVAASEIDRMFRGGHKQHTGLWFVAVTIGPFFLGANHHVI